MSFKIPELTKTSNPKKPSLKLFFPAFPQDRRLCPVTYLRHYEGLTKEFRPGISDNKPNHLFLSILSPHKPVTSSTLSRWIKCILKDSGIDTSSKDTLLDQWLLLQQGAKVFQSWTLWKLQIGQTQIPSPNFITNLLNLLSLATRFCPTGHMGVCIRWHWRWRHKK